ncbi:MAG: aminodeoxychorismate/anthranilate synthase component II [Vampirovibrionales bacterium]|nr:aminodeoxychorismate/anthranilate synthase component II [Vampirovibrionales bacterium]
MTAPVVIIDNFDSFTYNLYQMTQALTTRETLVFRNNALDFDALLALRPDRAILSPGPGHPANEKDFGVCREVVTRYEALACPVLGVCLGHQGIAHHLGGSVRRAPEIVHGKTSMIEILEPSPLFEGLPNPFEAMRYHSLVVSEDDLPTCLRIIAREVRSGLPMALCHASAPLYGVQFHPESIGTPQGGRLLENFLTRC